MRPITLSVLFTMEQAPHERESVLASAVGRCYQPLIDALWGAPHVKAALYLSGSLLDYVIAERPHFVERLRGLFERDQIELVGGSRYSAVIHSLPERDAVMQLRAYTLAVRAALKLQLSRGVWLDAGAWDPSLPRVLSRGGFQYTFLDQRLLSVGGLAEAEMGGWYVAEREGAAIGVLPLDRRLGEMVPWALPRFFAAELQRRARQGRRSLTVAVPAEQMGLAPESHYWCWQQPRGWVHAWFRMFSLQSSWLKLACPSQVVDRLRPGARVYPSAGTAPQVGVSALPAAVGRSFGRLQRSVELGDDPVLAEASLWMGGPPWESFLVRYEESNRLHKRMLRASAAVERLRRRLREQHDRPAAEALRVASAALLSGQTAAPLHSGPGGCVTRGDLRHVAWRSLAEAERVALIALGEAEGLVHEVVDYDCDGLREVLVSTEHLGAVVRPASGGGLAELHLWGTGNFVNTLTRREEAWFALLAGLSKMPSLIGQQVAGGEDDEVDDDLLDDEDSTPSAVGRALGPVELPQRPPTPALDRGLETMLDVDPSVRACFLDRFLSPQTTLRSLMRGQPSEQGDFVGALYGLVSAEVIDTGALQVVLARDGTVSDGELKRLVRLTKRYRFPADRPVVSVDYEIVNRYHEPIHTRFAIELTLNLDSSREATRFLQVPGRTRINLDDSGELADVDRLEYVMEDLGVQVVMTTPTSATVTWYPVKTPERRVEGIGSSYQGHCILFGWDLELWGQEKSLFSLEIEVHRGAPNTERVPAPELPEPTSQSSQSSRRGES